MVGLHHADRPRQVLATAQRAVEHDEGGVRSGRPLGGHGLGGTHALLERQRKHLRRRRSAPCTCGRCRGGVTRSAAWRLAENSPRPSSTGPSAGTTRLAPHRTGGPRRGQAGLGLHAARVVVGPDPHPGIDPAHAVDEHDHIGHADAGGRAARRPHRRVDLHAEVHLGAC